MEVTLIIASWALVLGLIYIAFLIHQRNQIEKKYAQKDESFNRQLVMFKNWITDKTENGYRLWAFRWNLAPRPVSVTLERGQDSDEFYELKFADASEDDDHFGFKVYHFYDLPTSLINLVELSKTAYGERMDVDVAIFDEQSVAIMIKVQ